MISLVTAIQWDTYLFKDLLLHKMSGSYINTSVPHTSEVGTTAMY